MRWTSPPPYAASSTAKIIYIGVGTDLDSSIFIKTKVMKLITFTEPAPLEDHKFAII